MRGVMPQQAITLVSTELTAISSSYGSKLGAAFALSVLAALWSARSGTSTLMTAINIAYEERENRGFFRFAVEAFALTFAVVAFTVVALALVAVLPAIIGLLPLGSFDKTLASLLRWPLLVALIMLSLSAIYRFAPSRAAAKWRWVSPGAAVATVLWLAGSALFSLYVSRFGAYDKTYGSLAAVAVLMIWLYVSSFAIVLGAGLNAELEHQTARDSTTGPPEPMGRRGAAMANTVGKAR
jgi:membrane protein